MGGARRAVVGLVLLAVAVGAELWLEVLLPDAAWRQLAMFAMINVVAALSLNVINGMAGQFSIGHAGFVAVGAYTAAVTAGHLHVALGSPDPTFGRSFIVMPLSILAAALVSAAFGLLVGLPSLRLRGDYLAIVTFGFAEIIRLVLATASPTAEEGTVSWHLAQLGGQQGYAGVDDTGIVQYAGPFWMVGGMLLAVVVSWRLKFSGWGRALRALREDEIAAAAVGVDPTRYKVTSFVISAVGGGIAGALLAGMRDGNPTVQPEQFNFMYSFDIVTMVILGGSGSVSGAVLGGIFVTVTVRLIEQLQRLDAVQAFRVEHPDFDLNALRMVVYAAVLIAVMVLRPSGVFGENEIVRPKPGRDVPPPTRRPGSKEATA